MIVSSDFVLGNAYSDNDLFDVLMARYRAEKAEMESYVQKANELVRESGVVLNGLATAETRMDADEIVAKSTHLIESAAGYRSDAMGNWSEIVDIQASLSEITGTY